MNYEEAKARCRNPQCVHHADDYVIVEYPTGEVIQSSSTVFSAGQAVDWLTDHERRNGRATKYRIVRLTKTT
jgi:hypothetical protein